MSRDFTKKVTEYVTKQEIEGNVDRKRADSGVIVACRETKGRIMPGRENRESGRRIN